MPSRARAAAEVAVGLTGVSVVVVLVPLSSPWFVVVTAVACGVVAAYGIYGATRLEGAAKWWGFVWGGRSHDDLARGLFNTGLLFVGSLIPIAVVKCLVRTPSVQHPAAYLFWCFAQDFLFFSLVMRGIERLLAGSVVGHRHLAVWITALLFGLSHFPMYGFMLATAIIAVFWGYIFLRSRLLWPVTASHFVLGLMVMS